MNLKEFLKPDWRKIVITFILSFIGIYTLWIPGWHHEEPTRSIIVFLSLIFGFPYITSYYHILIIIYNYLLSCFIVWIYDRFRKGKKK